MDTQKDYQTQNQTDQNSNSCGPNKKGDHPLVYMQTKFVLFSICIIFRTRFSTQANYQFSSDELRVLRECDYESFFKRSVPLGTSFGLAAYMAVKKGILKVSIIFFMTHHSVNFHCYIYSFVMEGKCQVWCSP